MDTVKLTRTLKLPDGTFGGILTTKKSQWFTCEKPWLDNKNNVSCIPTGKYICKWTKSPRLKKYTYEVTNVPNRGGIRIHSANFPSQLLGCIALGEKIGVMDGQKGVFLSTAAVRHFNSEMDQRDFILEISEVGGKKNG